MSVFAAALYVIGAFSALMSVAADAFAAHGLAAVAPAMEQAVVWFKEGANFQMNHALGLLLATAIAERLSAGRARTAFRASAILFAVGASLFSGALYSISFAGPGFFAPWGGISAMLGWIVFGAGAVLSLPKAIGGGSNVG